MSARNISLASLLDAYIRHGIPQERPDLERAKSDLSELIAAARAGAESLRHHGAHLHADRLLRAINAVTP